MASNALRNVKVLPNSMTLEEARKRVLDFFKTASRSLASVMEIYNIHDVVTVSQLRSTVAAEIRKNSRISDPKLKNIVDHSKQRHYIIGQYVVGRQGAGQELGTKDERISNFLRSFYKSNYF